MDVKNPLGSLHRGSKIFIDANIFLYSIFGHPTLKPQCKEFLLKVENGVYESVTSTLVLNEVIHKLMLAEIAKIKRLTSERDSNIIDGLRNLFGDAGMGRGAQRGF